MASNPTWPDVAVVGGGLCGLALAHSLHARGVRWRLHEARPRLGGRVRTERTAGGAAVDLGPTWFWPDSQPSMARLVHDLGLPHIAQPDDDQVVLLDDPNRPPRRVPAPALHGGARRVVGGMAAVVDALAAPLPKTQLRCGDALASLHDAGDHVELRFASGEVERAGCVVLALPPRLAAAHVGFSPALPPALQAALHATPTWMATAAKAAMGFDRVHWSGSGSAWVTHPQAVLAEVWDAGTPEAPALAGFVAPGVEARAPWQRSLPMLVDSQLGMLFGPAAGSELLHADWATEPWTCSPRDRAEDGTPPDHGAYGDPLLAAPAWDGRLWFGGSETAARGGGYLEGALQAAARLRRELLARLRPAVVV